MLREESPGSIKQKYWLTARHLLCEEKVTESATESIPPISFGNVGKGETVG